jgi:hypothetical protein
MPSFGGREFSLEQLFKMRDMMEGLSDEQKRVLLSKTLYGNGDFSGVPTPGIESKNLQVQNGMTDYNDGMSMQDLFDNEEEVRRMKRRYPAPGNNPERYPIIRGHPFKGHL